MYFILMMCTVSLTAAADHITGGEMYYTYGGTTNGFHLYKVTLKLYMRCNSGRNFNDPTIVSIYEHGSNKKVRDIYVKLSSIENIRLPSNSDPCITNAPLVCFDVGYYLFDVALPSSLNGYVLASLVNYRIAGINNLSPGYSQIGATYTAQIPGTAYVGNAPVNNSALFTGSDLVMVCADNSFTYSFAAQDKDPDELRYFFAGAYVSGNNSTVSAAPPPPYQIVPYGSGFTENSPLGNQISIDHNTGMLTGIAPAAGVYVVTVGVEEIRNGIVIATQRKDIQIYISPCTIASATLPADYMLCRDSRTIQLSNGSMSPLIKTYNWEVISSNGNTLYHSDSAAIIYTFPDTGTFKVHLFINKEEVCSDSTSSVVRVYPGLIPSFDISGICFTKPTIFSDKTNNQYGTIQSWKWNFGEPTRSNDISTVQNPNYTYSTIGNKDVQLIITTSMGCTDTVTRTVMITDKPPIDLAFRDTLICLNDSLRLIAFGNGSLNWTPVADMINPNSPDPIVSPKSTTTYTVELNDNGCLNKDLVTVRVVDHVTLDAMKDTIVCSGDQANLRVSSDALHFSWTPVSHFTNSSIPNPVTTTDVTTTYKVTARIGSCVATEEIIVTAIPYPVADAGKDTVICYGTSGQLKGSTNAPNFNWSSGTTVAAISILDHFVQPKNTTAYILSAYDNLGCPKAGRDTMIMTVRQKIMAYAGKDTAVIVGQPLQFKATGGVKYQWSPGLHLSSAIIPNPVGVFTDESDRIRYSVYVFDEKGCFDSTSILVSIYKTLPVVFVPNAFTPNNDKLNDFLKPIATGIDKIEYFNIYNRWGQLVFSTNVNGKGWDGKINGQEQQAQTYIWVVKAVDFKGQPYFKRGTFSLIR